MSLILLQQLFVEDLMGSLLHCQAGKNEMNAHEQQRKKQQRITLLFKLYNNNCKIFGPYTC